MAAKQIGEVGLLAGQLPGVFNVLVATAAAVAKVRAQAAGSRVIHCRLSGGCGVEADRLFVPRFPNITANPMFGEAGDTIGHVGSIAS